MMRVRRKLTEHDAILYNGINCNEVAEFVGCDWRCDGCDGTQSFLVETLHGPVDAEPGTWIVKGERDCWPVQHDQFVETYEVIE